jgi:transcriptional regulator with XRE-family HTH domain
LRSSLSSGPGRLEWLRNVGSNLRAHRARRFLSQTELARLAGQHFSQTIISEIERGLAVTPDEVRQLARALEIPETALLAPALVIPPRRKPKRRKRRWLDPVCTGTGGRS